MSIYCSKISTSYPITQGVGVLLGYVGDVWDGGEERGIPEGGYREGGMFGTNLTV